jgi:hypothetical protein
LLAPSAFWLILLIYNLANKANSEPVEPPSKPISKKVFKFSLGAVVIYGVLLFADVIWIVYLLATRMGGNAKVGVLSGALIILMFSGFAIIGIIYFKKARKENPVPQHPDKVAYSKEWTAYYNGAMKGYGKNFLWVFGAMILYR